MNNLTHRYTGGMAWASIRNVVACGETECIGPIIDRLAAYEDTGLEPQEITELMAAHGTAILELSEYRQLSTKKNLLELAQAEKDGRLVVLPCKPGQMVWAESPVRGRSYGFGAPDIAWIIENKERFGREIFLTREEAEAALKKREDAK